MLESRVSDIYRKAGRFLAAMVIGAYGLSGCSASQQPSSMPLKTADGSYPATPAPSQNILLYAAGNRKSYVLSYPDGTLVGRIDRPSFGACSDSNGNVYMTGVGSVAEFAYGQTTPFASANVPGTAYSCSVDPTTGDLAVVVFCSSGCTDEVAIFPSLADPPQFYETSALTQMLYCGYDAAGNLFVDGYDKQHFALAELPAGQTTFSPIAVGQTINIPGQVQWDGQYMTLEDAYNPVIYRLAISGSSATPVGSTQLHSVGRRAGQSWIGKGIVVVPTAPNAKRAIELGVWLYPRGGNRLHVIKWFLTPHKQITGVTMSVLPSGQMGPRLQHR